MNFITTYLELLMSHPLTTPVVSVGLLALALHLILPLACEVWRYYPNKITGTETVDNWYYEWMGCTKTHNTKYFYFDHEQRYYQEHTTMEEALNHVRIMNERTDKLNRSDCWYERETKTQWSSYFWSVAIVLVAATLASLLIEYLLSNFFIYTLVAGLAVGLHFTVVLLGKKLYSVSEDVKLLKKAAATTEEKT